MNVTINDIENEITHNFKNNRVSSNFFTAINLIYGFAIIILIILAENFTKMWWIFALIILILSIIYFIFLKTNYKKLMEPLVTNRQRITIRLLRIASKIESHLNDPIQNRIQLDSARVKDYSSLKEIIKNSIQIYQGPLSIEKINAEILKDLNNYLSYNMKKIKKGNIENKDLMIFKENLRNIAKLFYHGEFNEVKKLLNQEKYTIEPSNFINNISSPFFLSHAITSILLITILVVILIKFPITNISQASSYISILSIVLAYAFYSKIQKPIMKLLEFVSSLSFYKEYNINKIN